MKHGTSPCYRRQSISCFTDINDVVNLVVQRVRNNGELKQFYHTPAIFFILTKRRIWKGSFVFFYDQDVAKGKGDGGEIHLWSTLATIE